MLAGRVRDTCSARRGGRPGWWPAGCCGRWRDVAATARRSPSTDLTGRDPAVRRADRRARRRWPARSTRCSTGCESGLRRASGTSSTTPATSCAPRSRSSAATWSVMDPADPADVRRRPSRWSTDELDRMNRIVATCWCSPGPSSPTSCSPETGATSPTLTDDVFGKVAPARRAGVACWRPSAGRDVRLDPQRLTQAMAAAGRQRRAATPRPAIGSRSARRGRPAAGCALGRRQRPRRGPGRTARGSSTGSPGATPAPRLRRRRARAGHRRGPSPRRTAARVLLDGTPGRGRHVHRSIGSPADSPRPRRTR